jgi:anti-anti-sigma factor
MPLSLARCLRYVRQAIVSYSEHPPVICCAGDEDRSTQSLRRPALSRALHAGETVFVDLHELVFADPSLMVDLAMVARRLRQAGGHMCLRGAQPQIQRLIEVVGLHRLPNVVMDPAPTPA